jgi:tetrahydromethanopterin S-methyltransferase subunit G
VNGVCDRVNELEKQKIDRGVYSAHLESIDKRLTGIERKIDVLSGHPTKILSVDRDSH